MRIVECPDGDGRLPAEVLDIWDFASTAGPMHHMKTRCVGGHVFTVPTDVHLPSAVAPVCDEEGDRQRRQRVETQHQQARRRTEGIV